MPSDLSRVFFLGKSGKLVPFEPDEEFSFFSQKKQLEQLYLAGQQIKIQEAAARDITQRNLKGKVTTGNEVMARDIHYSTLKGADIIVNEIREQTSSFRDQIKILFEAVCNPAGVSVDRIAATVDILGDRICAESIELRWQMAQINCTRDDDILNELKNRPNDAVTNFVRQGLDLYYIEDIEGAEKRFLKASEEDGSDYQVLMNLGFIEIHKGNWQAAVEYFGNARERNQTRNMSNFSKARTLWATARVYYAVANYEKALGKAKEAFLMEPKDNPEAAFNLGIYAALAGETAFAIHHIKKAILLKPGYFTRAASEPDLDIIKDEVLDLLCQLAIDVYEKSSQSVQEMEELISNPEERINIAAENNPVNKVKEQLDYVREKMEPPRYVFSLLCIKNIQKLKSIFPVIGDLFSLYDDQKSENEKCLELKSSMQRSAPTRALSYLMIMSIVLASIMLLVAIIYAGIKDANPFNVLFSIFGLGNLSPVVKTIHEMLGYAILFVIVALFFGWVDHKDKEESDKCLKKLENEENKVKAVKRAIEKKQQEIDVQLQGIHWEELKRQV